MIHISVIIVSYIYIYSCLSSMY